MSIYLGEIGMRLKELRKNKGISQVKLAMELSMSQNTISRYETGEREPGIKRFNKNCRLFWCFYRLSIGTNRQCSN